MDGGRRFVQGCLIGTALSFPIWFLLLGLLPWR